MSCKCKKHHGKCKCKCTENPCTRDLRDNLVEGQHYFFGLESGQSVIGQLLKKECGKLVVNDELFGLTFVSICNIDIAVPANGVMTLQEIAALYADRRS